MTQPDLIVVVRNDQDAAREQPKSCPGNHAQAANELTDSEYVAYCVRESVHQLYAMLRKRWPDFTPLR